jgi:hypothetical protein
MRVQVTTRLRRRRNFFLRVAQIKKAKDFICRRATYKGKYKKAEEAVESPGAGLSPQEGDLRKRKEKKKTKEGKKVAPTKARFCVPYTKNSFFLVH